jgi:hypothetical protein
MGHPGFVGREGGRFVHSRECPHLKIEIWGTWFVASVYMWAIRPVEKSIPQGYFLIMLVERAKPEGLAYLEAVRALRE